jgi:hypothetical protein
MVYWLVGVVKVRVVKGRGIGVCNGEMERKAFDVVYRGHRDG